MRPRPADVLVGLLLLALPLSTAGLEIATGLCLAAALLLPEARARLDHPLLLPALAVALVWVAAIPTSGDVREGFGHAWVLAPLLAVPALRPDPRVAAVGVGAAGLAAAWALGQAVQGAQGTAGFSHHLSLAYALLPPLGVAIARGWRLPAALLVLGVLATRSVGALPALGATLLAAQVGRPAVAAGLGAALTVALLPLAAPDEVAQRAVLWTGGLSLLDAPVGPGGYPAASALAYDAIQPGFWFPNHAHDSAVQLLAVLGPAGLVAMAWLVARALRHGDRGAAAGLAGVLVGVVTQDVFGDLEVARATWTWLALGLALPAAVSAPAREPAPAPVVEGAS